ncbi:5576_t:CDS:1, partial [Racocetra fulgida]
KIFYRSKWKNNEPQECVICLEDFVDEDELKILPCKHEFH